MSKVCQEPENVVGTNTGLKTVLCNKPAMARWNDRWVCWGCLEVLESLEKLKKERDAKNPPRR